MARGKARLPPRWVIVMAWHVHRAIFRASGGRKGLWRPGSGPEEPEDPHQEAGRQHRAYTADRRCDCNTLHCIGSIGYSEDGPNLVSMAMNGWGAAEPAWWLNLQADPQAVVELAGGDRRTVRGRAAVGEERERLWRRWRELDKNLDSYAARRPDETAVVVLEPAATTT